MDIELTSARDDDTFTWRAAGARQPKGAVAASMLPPGSKVGDVVRIEAELEIDGITILSVLPPKQKVPVAGRIEVVGTQRPVAPVTTVLAGPLDRRRESRFFRDGGEQRPGRGASERGARRDRPADSRARPADSRDRPAGTAAPGESRDRRPPARRPDSDRSTGARPRPEGERDGSHPRSSAAGASREGSGPRREFTGPRGEGRGPRPDGAPSGRPSGPARPPASRGDAAGRTGSREAPARRGPVRFEPGSKHRDELMATLPPEQRLVAERLASGGMPAVRKAIAEEQDRARTEGRPPVSGESIIALAEQLQRDVKAAVWLDRAEAAMARIDELSLRDLRATVIAATPKDDAGRDLERQLREGLERRVTKLRTDWEEHLTQALAEGRVLQALRLSARPPEPTARFPASMVERLASQAGAAMTTETSPERWLVLLEAAVACPVRRQIKPAGIPEDASGEVQRKAREAAGRVPALAQLLGMSMPPPPLPLPGEKVLRPHPPRPPRPPGPPAGARSRLSRASSDLQPSSGREAPPAGHEPAPVTDETAAASAEPAPVTDETAAASAEPAPVTDETASAPEAAPPAADDSAALHVADQQPPVSQAELAAPDSDAVASLGEDLEAVGQDVVLNQPSAEPVDQL
jgi:hypothetical protein